MVDRSALAGLPKVNAVLEASALRGARWRRAVVRRRVRAELARLRQAVRDGRGVDMPDAEALASSVAAELARWASPKPARVINATGVVLHTNLGRTPLAPAAVEAMVGASGYCDLEVELRAGTRRSRFERLRPLISAVLGAEDAHVVNNNAGALLLACTALGAPGGVVLSRGQMVEIGDSFRVATLAAAGGCPVVPVGSTNRTHPRDYEEALAGDGSDVDGCRPSALLWCHQSNFRQEGYVQAVGLPELARLAKAHGVPLIADLGSGSLGAGLPETEPTIENYFDQGVDVLLASGDKLLGGPQSGIIAGAASFVERCRRHPMARALRIDKTTVAALHATFVAHAQPDAPSLPLHAMVARTVAELRARAMAIASALTWGEERVVSTEAALGGGSSPGDTLNSIGLWVPTDKPARLARELRLGEPPVVGRIEGERLLLDLRTVDPADDDRLVTVLRDLARAGGAFHARAAGG